MPFQKFDDEDLESPRYKVLVSLLQKYSFPKEKGKKGRTLEQRDGRRGSKAHI